MKLALLALLTCTTAAADQYVEWRNNYKEALQEARQTRKPLFVEFRCEA
jgi:hypothetical protein